VAVEAAAECKKLRIVPGGSEARPGVNQSGVNQSSVNQSSVNQSSVNQSSVGRSLTKPVHERYLVEELLPPLRANLRLRLARASRGKSL
jgi:hypothetical protein